MKRRALALLIGTVVMSGLTTGAHALGGASTASAEYWGCVGVRAIDHGICLKNPLPERLPLPATPTVPAAS